MLARVPTVGCRRVGGALAGVPFETNMVAGARLAASLDGVDTLILEGSGACVPPVEADATVCVVGEPARRARGARPVPAAARRPRARDARRAGRARASSAPAPWSQVRLSPSRPSRCRPARAWRSSAPAPATLRGVEPVVTLARTSRGAARSTEDLARAAQEGCDVYLTELKAAAIDTVAAHARRAGRARRLRAQPRVVADGADLDDALAGAAARWLRRSSPTAPAAGCPTRRA